MDKFLKYFSLVKVDEAQQIVYGLVTAERLDKDGEICHYDSTVPLYKAVNEEMSKATDGANIMPLREMHQLHAVGAGKSIEFDDAKKEIRMAFKVVESSTWNKVLEKVLTGFSQGGKYVKRWKQDGKDYYTADPGEVSLVDNPCLSGAVIEYVKANGAVETFKVPDPPLARLTDADVERISKALSLELSTQAEKKSADEAEAVRQRNAAKGEPMNKEQIAKCAAALGITPEEFSKQFIEGELFKGAKGLAAVHSHLEAISGHHAEMGKCHKAMGGLHEKMGTHIEKCMKAAADVAGSDGEKGEKAWKALVGELAAAAKTSEEMVKIGTTADGVDVFRKKDSKEVKLEGLKTVEGDLAKTIADAIKAATEPLQKKIEEMEKTLAPNNGGTGARLALIDRDGNVLNKGAEADSHNPMAVS